MPAKKEPTEAEAFNTLLGKVLSVPKAEILRREAEYKKRADQNPRKRGPKRKVNTP
jgi:hypothetical protein